MKNDIESGDVLYFTAPAGGVASGGAYQIGNLLVMAAGNAVEGAKFQGVTVGIFDVPKIEDEAWAEGEKIYFDEAGSPDPIFTDQSGGLLVGVAASKYPPNVKIFSSADASDLSIVANVL